MCSVETMVMRTTSSRTGRLSRHLWTVDDDGFPLYVTDIGEMPGGHLAEDFVCVECGCIFTAWHEAKWHFDPGEFERLLGK